jgi:PAS domain S-box-containing protein
MNHLIDLVTGGVCLFKVSQNLHIEALYLNQTCCNLFGTDKNSYTNQAYRLDELIHPEDKSLVFQAIGKSMASKKPIDLEFRVKEHADSYIWCKCNADIQRYDSDNCPIFHAMFTDITRIKEAEEKADRESEAMVKLFKNLPGAVFCASAKNPFVLDVVSADFLKLLGCSRSEFYEKNSGDLSKYIYSSDVENAVADIANQSKNAKEGKEISTTYCVKAKDGSFITVEDKRKLIELQNGVKTELGVLQAVDTQHIDTKIYAQTILNK